MKGKSKTSKQRKQRKQMLKRTRSKSPAYRRISINMKDVHTIIEGIDPILKKAPTDVVDIKPIMKGTPEYTADLNHILDGITNEHGFRRLDGIEEEEGVRMLTSAFTVPPKKDRNKDKNKDKNKDDVIIDCMICCEERKESEMIRFPCCSAQCCTLCINRYIQEVDDNMMMKCLRYDCLQKYNLSNKNWEKNLFFVPSSGIERIKKKIDVCKNERNNCKFCYKPIVLQRSLVQEGICNVGRCDTWGCERRGMNICVYCGKLDTSDHTCERLESFKISKEANPNVKICPRCLANVERTEGCNDMSCYHCGVRFCWCCLQLRHGFGDFFGGAEFPTFPEFMVLIFVNMVRTSFHFLDNVGVAMGLYLHRTYTFIRSFLPL